ncbi:hypothetical protein PMO31116_02212 [Pandoraea morbifera]|uniref:Uncharacterized protein n=1 Tax=Pandoraea morbifera TaxID=2508300 RepID=A0A5E4USK4_9BURK|nr:hypothetical protein [Pandoraea morbifera]VVE02978.1 hypothetical protein PMO31116_02212 [Pandoraea morbifera]
MKHRQEREGHHKPAPAATRPRTVATARPDLPQALPCSGYVVWFHESRTFLDIRFDPHRFEIVTTRVPGADDAFYFDSPGAARGHAQDADEPCLVLFAATARSPVRVIE